MTMTGPLTAGTSCGMFHKWSSCSVSSPFRLATSRPVDLNDVNGRFSLAFSIMSCPCVIYESVRAHLIRISSRRPLVSANRFLTDKDVQSRQKKNLGYQVKKLPDTLVQASGISPTSLRPSIS
jgi:hypothetical protein